MLGFRTNILDDNDEDSLKDLHLFNNRLSLHPILNKVNTYLVSLSFFDKNDEETNKLNYEILLTFLEKIKEGYVFKVHKKELYINGKEPSLLIEQIASEFNEILYPLEVLVKYTGEVIAVQNITEIQERWRKEKKVFHKKYEGAIIYKLITQFDSAVTNAAKLVALLHKDIFFQVFFRDIYQSYNDKNQLENTMHLNLQGSTLPISFTGINTIVPKITSNNTIAVHFEGTCILDEAHELSRKLKSKQQNSGDLVVSYDLNKETRLPEMIQMVTSFFNEKEAHLKTIEVFIAKEVTKKAPVVLLEEDAESVPVPKKKKGFFSIFKSKTK